MSAKRKKVEAHQSVTVGSVWISNDPRVPLRTRIQMRFKISKMVGPWAHVINVIEPPRARRIQLCRFNTGVNGYSPFKEL